MRTHHVQVFIDGKLVLEDKRAKVEDEYEGELELIVKDNKGWDHIVQIPLDQLGD